MSLTWTNRERHVEAAHEVCESLTSLPSTEYVQINALVAIAHALTAIAMGEVLNERVPE